MGSDHLSQLSRKKGEAWVIQLQQELLAANGTAWNCLYRMSARAKAALRSGGGSDPGAGHWANAHRDSDIYFKLHCAAEGWEGWEEWIGWIIYLS